MRFVPAFLLCLLLVPAAAWSSPLEQMLKAAHAQVGVTTLYDSGYQRLSYPGGDVPIQRGVCSDVVIRAMRGAGIDLQKAVHEDMRAHFSAYPDRWGLKQPDANIDHRRVPNLETWFSRQGDALAISENPSAYRAGDIVSWRLPNGLPHIGIVVEGRSPDGQRPLVLHNIGAGARIEDVLFAWKQVGHYRPFPSSAHAPAGDHSAAAHRIHD